VISARFKNIRKQCKKIAIDFDQKAIHGFRTEVKKMRAYIRLVSFVWKDAHASKLPKKFKKLYSAAGDVRDIQLQLERITLVTSGNGLQIVKYSHLLEKKLGKKKKKLKKLIQQTSMHSLEKKIVSHLPKRLDMETIRKFIQQKTAETRLLSKIEDERDDDIHSIRKNLKDLMYNAKTIEDDELKEAFPSELSEPVKLRAVEKLTDKLGMFTDLSAAISFTEPSYVSTLNSAEKDQLQHIRERWLHEKKLLREDALKDIHEQAVLV
jgi:CHAD domain-containing protein